MNIGYDGKRAFQNKTGLGNYSRSLVTILSLFYPQNRYTLFAPRQTGLFDVTPFDNVRAVFPETFAGKKFPGWWRRNGIIKAVKNSGIDIYHGLSNELPLHIERGEIKTVVTIHDIIFERFPGTYHFDERLIYRWKIKRACKVADAIIAISKQTKDDLVNIYGIPAEKIFTCYQNCNPIFQQTVTIKEKASIKKKYNLPDKYFLFVSSIAPRKNLLGICKALVLLKNKLDIPLVVIGDGKKEKEEAKKLMMSNGIADRLVLLNELPASKEVAFINAIDFPAICQQGLALIYPSVFEGFGIPLLEALWSGLPVICSNTSSLPEVAGDAALYFSPADHALLAKHMMDIATDPNLAVAMRSKGFKQAQNLTGQKHADSIMAVYDRVMVKRN